MPRPRTKSELLQLSGSNYKKLVSFIYQFPADTRETEFPEGTLNRNIRDVIAHLHHWHLMMLEWYRVGMTGAKPDMPSAGYTWKETGILNLRIREMYLHISLPESMDLFEKSHKEVTRLIKRHTNQELMEKRKYKWTGSTSLGAYLISATSSHYDWAHKLIKRNMPTG